MAIKIPIVKKRTNKFKCVNQLGELDFGLIILQAPPVGPLSWCKGGMEEAQGY